MREEKNIKSRCTIEIQLVIKHTSTKSGYMDVIFGFWKSATYGKNEKAWRPVRDFEIFELPQVVLS